VGPVEMLRDKKTLYTALYR